MTSGFEIDACSGFDGDLAASFAREGSGGDLDMTEGPTGLFDSLQLSPDGASMFATPEFFIHEARALGARLQKMRPFSLKETMVPAAAVTPSALSAIERHMSMGRRAIAEDVRSFIRWADSPAGRSAAPSEGQRRMTMLRLRFNAVLSQFDIFGQALTQRSECETGIWLAGLDVLAMDALAVPGVAEPPPVMCYLDRGLGAAIRRARTRLPGGSLNPVAIIRLPRERMVGCGIGSSLVHEVGHQAAALLGLLPSLRCALSEVTAGSELEREAWECYRRWISEIVSDLWSIGTLGVTATLGLVSVLSLPRAFMFRPNMDDPHPTPWVRTLLSCAMGRALFPDPQWDELESLWRSLYPLSGLPPERVAMFDALSATMPRFAELLRDHRPRSLGGRSIAEALPAQKRQPARLHALYSEWRRAPALMRRAPPTLVLATLGQARARRALRPEMESRIISRMLREWALESALRTQGRCARSMSPRYPDSMIA